MSFQMKLNLWLTGGFLLAEPARSGPKEKARRIGAGLLHRFAAEVDRL
jgi:hypothetical protein